MSALAIAHLPDTIAELFEDTSVKTVEQLLTDYAAERQHLVVVAQLAAGDDFRKVLPYFVDGNISKDLRSTAIRTSAQLFNLDGAVKALDADYWRRLLDLTDILSFMPEARRYEWYEQIAEHTVPPFESAIVAENLRSMLARRVEFFTERVDGVFKNLSPQHVTNTPRGFRTRMIMHHVMGSFGVPNSRQTGVLHDLRCVISKFLGRDNPNRSTDRLVSLAYRNYRGQWLDVDGGSWRLRVYKIGTAHIEIHEEIATRLNWILASLYPQAIAAEWVKRPALRKGKRVNLIDRPLPFAVLEAMTDMRDSRDPYVCKAGYGWGELDKHVRAEVVRVMQSLGGVLESPRFGEFRFDYDVREVIDGVLVRGTLPDHKSYQFYPTPRALARRVVQLAAIGPDHTVLEPSAGQGGLADQLPIERTTCVEISALHAAVLRAKGHTVVEQDFLTYKGPRVDRVVMNPPFESRWQTHLTHVAGLVKPGGRLVAILPSSARGKAVLPSARWSLTWGEEQAFPGTSISVIVLVADAAA